MTSPLCMHLLPLLLLHLVLRLFLFFHLALLFHYLRLLLRRPFVLLRLVRNVECAAVSGRWEVDDFEGVIAQSRLVIPVRF